MMAREFELDITERVRRDGPNAMAVKIHPPTTCDLALTWVDWNPHPPDKNMGLWRDVWGRWPKPDPWQGEEVAQTRALAVVDAVAKARLLAGNALRTPSSREI